MLDGAMGTMIQRLNLSEADFRGERFRDHGHDLRGDNDVLVLTRPEAITAIHDAYFAAGSDIVETNTFNSTRIAMADYGMQGHVRELNLRGARVAREAADGFTQRTPHQPRYVAGVLPGTVKVIWVSVQPPAATVAEVPPTFRVPAELPKLAPFTTT